MPGRKVVIPREKELPLVDLLAGVGLTIPQWETYRAILEHPSSSLDELPDASATTLKTLCERGLLRPSLERSLGYAPIPPRTAFSKIMERYDTGMLEGLKAGRQLRKLMREVYEAKPQLTGVDGGSGIEVYEDLSQARDRIYELALASPGRSQVTFDTRIRATHRVREDFLAATASAAAATDQLDEYPLNTSVLDKHCPSDDVFRDFYVSLRVKGERILSYPGELAQLILRQGSHLVLWRDPFPSRAATLIVTARWALELAQTYVDLILPLCQPWISLGDATPSASPREDVASWLIRGLTDDQIAARTGQSARTVGRHVADILEELGATTRFQGGVLLERQRLASTRLSEAGRG